MNTNGLALAPIRWVNNAWSGASERATTIGDKDIDGRQSVLLLFAALDLVSFCSFARRGRGIHQPYIDVVMHLPQLTTVVLLVTSGWALPQATGKTEKVPPSKANNGKAGPASWEVPATPAIVGGTLAVAGAAVYGSLRVAQWRRDQPIIKHYLSLDRRGRQMYREDYAYHLYMQNEGRDEFAMLLCLTVCVSWCCYSSASMSIPIH